MTWIYIIIFILAIIVISQYKTSVEPFFSGKCLHYTIFNKNRDPYSIQMWRNMYNKHRRWNIIHRQKYIPYTELMLKKN